MRRRIKFALAASTWLVAAACGGGDGGPPSPPPPPTVASVVVALASASIPVGQTTTATATARDAQGATISGKTPSWSSANSSVASVSGDGTVTGVAAGSTEITATIDGRTGSATVTVTPPPVASVTVTLSAPTISVGQSTQATAVLRDGSGAVVTGRTVAWSSSNTGVATVSNAGLVVAVAAGSATITATSEGRTGSATVTITPPVSVGPLVLRNADGSAADPTNIAGRLRVSTAVDVPTGFRGVLEIRIRGILARRDSIVPAPGMLARAIDEIREVPTAVATIDANTLRTMVTWTNGPADLVVQASGVLPGGGSVSASQTSNITLRNMDALALIVINPRTTDVGGRTWAGGPGTQAFVSHAAFGGLGDLNRVEVIRGPGSTLYGSGAVAGVVNVITRTGSTSAEAFDLAGAGWESDANGTSFGLNDYRIGTTTYTPRTTLATFNGNAASVDYSGFHTSAQRAASLSLPVGVRYQETTFNLPPNWLDLSSQVSYLDFLAARAGPGAFEPTSRVSAVGQPAWQPNRSWGLSQNYLGASTDLKAFLDLSKFTDDGVGPGSMSDVTWHASTSLSTLWSTSSQITGVGDIPASTSRSYYLGATGKEALGNTWRVTARTNLANPWTTGPVVATGAQLGTTDAIFGRLTTGGAMTWGGVPSGSVFNNTAALNNYQVTATATGSLYDASAFGAASHRYGQTMDCFLGFSHCMIPEVLSSTVTQNGTQAAVSLSLGTLRTRWSALGGGTGPFQLNYSAADQGGNASSGFQPWIGYFDFVRPTTSVGVVNGQNGNVTVNVTGSDPGGGLERVDYGARFNLPQSLFYGGKLYAWFHTAEVGGNLSSGLNTSVAPNVSGRYPVGGRWYNPNGSGIDRTTLIPVDGICARVHDWGRNASLPACVSHAPTTAPVAVSTGLSNLRAGVTASTLCNNSTCSGSTPNEVTAWLEADVLTTLDELAKMFLLGIPPGGEVFPMGKADTPTLVQNLPGGARRLRWETRFTNADYCLAFTGLLALKIVALSSDGWNVFFPSQFFFLNVIAGTGLQPGCTRPPRPLI